ncbi:MAG: cyanophycinase [Ignavibacteriales bacterium CG_4_9_14_3_um_filter_34_10]|nr:MAG: cyanophycinase [Ignavibacteriales bacterium CG_4_9_14_3_um_filter_34_10]
MKSIKYLFMVLFLFQTLLQAQSKGYLVIVGGVQTKEIQKKFVELAGGKDARIIIIPNAGSEPKRSSESQQRDYISLGAQADYLLFNRETADNEENLKKMEWANAVFFLGGDQSDLTRDMIGTRLLNKVFDIYNKNGVVGGSSAGAAVMSEIMLTGNELINKDSSSSFISIQKGNIETAKGFGFIKNAIIDQHFLKRKRHNRLITLMCEHPNLLGIAIDESTAIIVKPDDTFEVIGRNQVLVYDPTESKNIKTDKSLNLGISNIKMHLLISGDKLNLKTREVIE